MMRRIDARIPHFRGDKDFLGRCPAIFMKPQICSGPKRSSLAVIVGLSLPRHAGFMVPIGEDAHFTVGVDWEIGMKPRALAFGMLIPAPNLLVKLHEQFALA